MSWRNAALVLPSSLTVIRQQAETITGQLPGVMAEATGRLAALAEQAQYRRHPLSDEAAALLGLRAELDALLATGRQLTVTPFMHGIGQQLDGQWTLSADTAVKVLATKLRDGADPQQPAGELHAVGWLVTGNHPTELANALAALCPWLPLPAWCATLRRLHASQDTMTLPSTPKTPHWTPDEPLCWDPLRAGRRLVGAELAQLESLAADQATPIERLSQLAARRQARLDELAQRLDDLAALQGQLWCWHGQGSVESLAAQLEQSGPPGAQSQSVGALLLSPTPLTFWQELTL
ncbi:hypothetical protein [Aeromonas sp. R10-1]|uniref:hypothetical protein n=1 Tax=Aeromonas sp. R10-1 TaxID=3138457 RepID=UPI0034A34D74